MATCDFSNPEESCLWWIVSKYLCVGGKGVSAYSEVGVSTAALSLSANYCYAISSLLLGHKSIIKTINISPELFLRFNIQSTQAAENLLRVWFTSKTLIDWVRTDPWRPVMNVWDFTTIQPSVFVQSNRWHLGAVQHEELFISGDRQRRAVVGETKWVILCLSLSHSLSL